ncbi:MAG TPA: helical backbone metal receptor [Candidatus Limnocylindrales bacterium]|nr:helical backbone metal receptor [Candidatus Limnocylindrales bacterium]
MDASPHPRPRHHPRLGALLAAIVLAVTAAGCGTTESIRITPQPGATGSALPPSTATPEPSPSPAFPVTLVDDEGTEVDIPAEPERIVSLTPATTEILFALGVGDRIVGRVEDITLFPPEAGPIPEVAGFGTVNIEAIVGLEPDLVIAGGNFFTPPDGIERLRSVGLTVLVVYAADVETVFADIELTGRAVGRGDEALALADAIRAEFDAVAAATADLAAPRVFYELDATGAIYGPADESFLAEMIALAGGDPITTGSPDAFEIPLERLIEADPEVILLGDAAYGVTAEAVAARAGWNVMTAVRDGAIRPTEDVIITRPGPRLGEGLRSLALAIHPDLDLPAEGGG